MSKQEEHGFFMEACYSMASPSNLISEGLQKPDTNVVITDITI